MTESPIILKENKNSTFSLICVYNDEKVLGRFLLDSIRKQSIETEIILIDNTKDKYLSAAEAFNSNIYKANGDYVIFSHQDISFGSNDFLRLFKSQVSILGKDFIVGVAGKHEDLQYVVSTIKHGFRRKKAGEWKGPSLPVPVQTVDECLFVVSRSMIENLKFDEDVCSGWDLYAVDYCLSARCIGQSYVLPAESVYHRSSGSLTEGYFDTLRKLANKHKHSFSCVCTTCGDWPTDMDKLEPIIQEIMEIKNKKKNKAINRYLKKITNLIYRHGDPES